MSEHQPPKSYRIRIDRIVLNGTSGNEIQKDRFRERVSSEIQRLLTQPETVEHIRSGYSSRVTRRVNDGESANAVQVARHVMQALQSTSPQ